MLFEKKLFFFLISSVHCCQWKTEKQKKKISTSRLAFWWGTRHTGNDFLLKDGLKGGGGGLGGGDLETILQSEYS